MLEINELLVKAADTKATLAETHAASAALVPPTPKVSTELPTGMVNGITAIQAEVEYLIASKPFIHFNSNQFGPRGHRTKYGNQIDASNKTHLYILHFQMWCLRKTRIRNDTGVKPRLVAHPVPPILSYFEWPCI